MKKNCKTCKKDFEIEQDDLNFYEKILITITTDFSRHRLQAHALHLLRLHWLVSYSLSSLGHTDIAASAYHSNGEYCYRHTKSRTWHRDVSLSKTFRSC